jgi:hypothetical protein
MDELGWWLIPLLLLGGLLAIVLAWRPLRRLFHEMQAERARELFALQRERLEAKFLEAAAASGKPRGLRWRDCEWESEVQFAKDRASHEINALVGVTISFEPIEGSEIEEWPAVRDLRQATGVFFFHKGHWHTHGRAIFNMDPRQALAHFREQYEPVAP